VKPVPKKPPQPSVYSGVYNQTIPVNNPALVTVRATPPNNTILNEQLLKERKNITVLGSSDSMSKWNAAMKAATQARNQLHQNTVNEVNYSRSDRVNMLQSNALNAFKIR